VIVLDEGIEAFKSNSHGQWDWLLLDTATSASHLQINPELLLEICHCH
jgi:hypothetical protein